MVVLDVVSWTSMKGMLEVEQANEALSMFLRMRAGATSADMVAMVNVISACAFLGDLRRGSLVHNQIVTRGIRLELHIINSLIILHSKCEDLESFKDIIRYSGRQKLGVMDCLGVSIGSGRPDNMHEPGPAQSGPGPNPARVWDSSKPAPSPPFGGPGPGWLCRARAQAWHGPLGRPCLLYTSPSPRDS